MIKCSYCGKNITKNDTYSVDALGENTHELCYGLKWTDKSWKQGLKRAWHYIRYKFFEIKSFVIFTFAVIYVELKRRRKNE